MSDEALRGARLREPGPVRALASSPIVTYGQVRRILILKLDHIGDMLIAAPALMLIRNSFPDADVTLICAPWNAGLVRRLGVADEVHCVTLYAPGPRSDARQAVIDAVEALDLPPFDLAIDLRRDGDTREFLKLFRARHKAGFGDSETFNFLDVALPTPIDTSMHGATRLLLAPADLDGGAGHSISQDGLRLTAEIGEVDLELSTDTLWPPSDDGIPDTRLLGAALWRVDMRTTLDRPDGQDSSDGGGSRWSDAAEIVPEKMRFDGHWLDAEPWGRWSNAHASLVTLRFPSRGSSVELLARVQGHTSPSHPVATVHVRVPGDEASHVFRTGDGPVALRLRATPRTQPVAARSDPFILHAGRYRGELRLHRDEGTPWTALVVKLRGVRLGHVVARYTTPGEATSEGQGAAELDRPLLFDFEHSDGAEPLLVEVSARDPDGARGIAIASLELSSMDLRAPKLPLSHIEMRLLDLAAMVAIRFAPRLQPAEPGSVAQRLSRTQPGSSATDALIRLERLRHRRLLVWKRFRGAGRRKLIGIGLGANKQTKLWPEEHFLALCRLLLRRPEVDLVFLGGPSEVEPVQRLLAQLRAGDRTVDLCRCCEIEDLGEVLAMLDGFVGLDTGTTHFAGRVGLRTAVIFGHAHDPREWGPVGERTAWVAAEIACRGCSYSEFVHCPNGVACMTDLLPDEIWPTIEEQLFGATASPAETP